MFLGGKLNEQGKPIKVNDAPQYIFGFVLCNDWSARDVQTWEYVPLGPFNSKNFATSISPWIVTYQALAAFKVPLEAQDPKPLSYLDEKEHVSFDIKLEVDLKTAQATHRVTDSNFKHLYWSPAQQLAHHSVTGCKMQAGDMLASGTISGPQRENWGCLLEIHKKGKEPLLFENGEKRTFLEDGDTVIMKGYAEKEGVRVGFGECSGKILPVHPESEYI